MESNLDSVVSKREGGVLRLALNRPEKLNAVTIPLLNEMTRLVKWAADEPEIRVIVIRGTGRGFCTGADLSALDAPPEEVMVAANSLIRAIVAAPLPVVSVVNGPAVGFGVGLALAGDLIYSSDRAYFYLSFVDIGLMLDGGTSWFVPEAIGNARASEMALLGTRLTANEAVDLGLVTRVIEEPLLDDHVDVVVKKLETGSPMAQAYSKLALRASQQDRLSSALDREKDRQVRLLVSADAREGIDAKLANRTAQFQSRRDALK